MPCYRCGVRQTDPGRGQSPWKRGVRRDSQVLICPHCQASDDWMADLARCPRCGSVHLVRRLGEVECRDCGAIVPPSAGPGEGEPLTEVALTETAGGEAAGGASPDLSEEVARALDRVLGRGLVSQSAPRTGADTR
jgi:ribosomal protein L40E